jgi:hypothetical protein
VLKLEGIGVNHKELHDLKPSLKPDKTLDLLIRNTSSNLSRAVLYSRDSSTLFLITCIALFSLRSLFFGPDVGGDMFLRNAGWLSSHYRALQPRIQNLKTYTSVFSFQSFKYFVKNTQKRRFFFGSCRDVTRTGVELVSESVSWLVSTQ